MSNFFINNNKIIIKILGLIITLFILDVIFENYYTNKITECIDNYLIYLGVREKKIEEGFLGPMDIPTNIGTLMNVTMAIMTVAFIAVGSKWVVNLGIGIGEAIFGGVMTGILGLAETAQGIGELIIFSLYLVRWFVDHIICGFKMMFSLPTCIFFYFINLIGQVLYLPFRATWFLLYMAGFETIYKYEAAAWKKVEEADIWFFENILPFHFAAWPKNIRTKCFSCVRLKMGSVGTKFLPVGDRFGKKLPRVVEPHVKTLHRGFMRIMDSFTKFP